MIDSDLYRSLSPFVLISRVTLSYLTWWGLYTLVDTILATLDYMGCNRVVYARKPTSGISEENS